jgi:hypothetical protein
VLIPEAAIEQFVEERLTAGRDSEVRRRTRRTPNPPTSPVDGRRLVDFDVA